MKKMAEDSKECLSETVHFNCDKGRYLTMVLLNMHDAMSSRHSRPSGSCHLNCWSLPLQRSQSGSNKAGIDSVFTSSCDFFEIQNQLSKQSRKHEADNTERSDYSLPGDSCINRQTFAYLPDNECYKKHKRMIKRKAKKNLRRSHENTMASERDEELVDPQTSLEFQQYLYQLLPSERIESEEGITDADKNAKLSKPEEQQKVSGQRSFCVNVTEAHNQAKLVLPRVQTKQSNIFPVRPSSFIRAVSASSVAKVRRDREYTASNLDSGIQVPPSKETDNAWTATYRHQLNSKISVTSMKDIDPHMELEREIMKRIKELHRNLSQPILCSETKTGQLSDSSLETMSCQSLKSDQKRITNLGVWGNPASQLGNATNEEFSRNIHLPHFPLRKHPHTYKAQAYNINTLASDPFLGYQPMSVKPLSAGLEVCVSALNPVPKSNSRTSAPSSTTEHGTSTFLSLQGRKTKTKKSNHRVL